MDDFSDKNPPTNDNRSPAELERLEREYESALRMSAANDNHSPEFLAMNQESNCSGLRS
jgi:hypothetical protein